jgi:hypothetical protein
MNMMHGRGVFVWPDRSKYDGEYVNNLKHGRGKMTWPCGKFYDGMWVNNLKNGTGIFRDSDTVSSKTPQKERMGNWKDGNLVNWIEKTSSKFVIQ